MATATLCVWVAALSAQQPPPPAATPPPAAEIRKAMEWKRFDYACASNAKLTVFLRDQTAKIIYRGHLYLMKQTMSADGNRYSDGRFVWWGRGNGGFMQEDTPDGNGAMVVKDCKLTEPEKKDPGVISGTVTYRERMALPPTAVIEVHIASVSRSIMGPIIAEQTIVAGGKQVPISFELKFDPAKIDPKYNYFVSAQISVDGQLRFATDKTYPVLAEGTSPSGIEIVVKPVAPKQ